MQMQTAWATGFLTQLLLNHLQTRYSSQIQDIDPRTFFSGVEGYEGLKDPRAVLLDSHAWLPEEVLREVLRTAERVSGRKDIAYQAAIDYFTRSADGRDRRSPSIFEIIARFFDDVKTVALCSDLWASAYTTFLRLQALAKDPAASELIVLSQCEPGFRPLLSTHFMIKGNYEGFVKLYDFVEEACLEEEFLQHRVREIVDEFEGYTVEEQGAGLKIVDRGQHRTVAVFKSVRLDDEEIPIGEQSLKMCGHIGFNSIGIQDGRIVHPESGPAEPGCLRVLTAREAASPAHADGTPSVLQVVRGGILRSGPLEYAFREGTFYDAPYSRYRFRWRERRRPTLQGVDLEKRIQKMTYLLFDYLHELRAAQQRLLAYAAENKDLTAENVYLRQEADEEWTSQKLLGRSPGMKAVLDLAQQIAATDSTVLITGETGTGKELMARLIHQSGNRHHRRFVAINCAAVPEGLLESELFGHERGAFTGAAARKVGKFEWADGGTIFLDEVGEIPLGMQVKLLRVLQERELQRVGGNDLIKLDLRIIAATNQDLKAMIDKGSFRKDLYYRLNVIPMHLPPLRERLEDLPELAEYFLAKFCRKLRKNVRTILPSALDLMQAYSWPGNIRELENVLERAITLIPAAQTILPPEFLSLEIDHAAQIAATPSRERTHEAWDARNVIDRIEWQTLVNAMKVEGSMDSFLRKIEWAMAQRAILEYGSKTEAARVLKRTYRWIRKLEKEMEDKPSA